MIYKDFKRLFTKREIQEINGKKRKNLAILTGILFGTFLAIAISFHFDSTIRSKIVIMFGSARNSRVYR